MFTTVNLITSYTHGTPVPTPTSLAEPATPVSSRKPAGRSTRRGMAMLLRVTARFQTRWADRLDPQCGEVHLAA